MAQPSFGDPSTWNQPLLPKGQNLITNVLSGGGKGSPGGGGGGGTAKDPRLGPDGKLGVWWLGQNGNIYTRDNKGVTTDMGTAKGKTEADMAQWRQIDDWNKADPNAKANADATGGGGGGIVYPDLTGAINILRENIKGLDPVYQAEVNNAIKNWEVSNNERISQYGKTKAASDASELSAGQDVLMSRNDINANARDASENLMSILGGLGMSGTATNRALGTVADTSNKNMNETNYSYGKNQQSILQNWNDYVNQDTGYQKQLEDIKQTGINQAGVNRATSTKDYLGQIASNKVGMGNFNTADELAGITAQNNILGNLAAVPKTYTGVTPTYTAPAVSTLLGQNMAKFDVKAKDTANRTPAKLIKVNEQTGINDKYGII